MFFVCVFFQVRRAAVQAVRGLQELTDDKNEPKVLSQFIPALVNVRASSLVSHSLPCL